MEQSKYLNDERTQNIINKANCPYQIFSEDFSVEEVNDIYKIELEKGKKEGYLPFLVVLDDTLKDWFGFLEDDSYSKEAVLQKNLNGEKILKERQNEYLLDYQEENQDDFNLSEFLGEKTGGENIDYLSSFQKYTGNQIEPTILFKVPIKNPWEVIAWFPIGGWNECPPAEEMMAVCRKWYEAYGAIPAVISHDTMEFILEKPVEDEQKAWELAKEHYAFCPDRVDQCTESYTLGELADCISKSIVWYFWWD